MQTLISYLESINENTTPKIWGSNSEKIKEEYNHLQKLLNKENSYIYGANTRPGHRDNEKIDTGAILDYQSDLLNSHTIAGDEALYSETECKFITYAKLYSWSAGMSGVSPVLFDSISKLATDKNFSPKIPKSSSYSCGDVIPASHWAQSILLHLKNIKNYTLKPGEAMALINGNFIQTGYAASLIEKTRLFWLLYIEISKISISISNSNASNLFFFSTAEKNMAKKAVDYIKKDAPTLNKKTQDPVSLRSTPQTIEALSSSIENYLSEINYMILKPSGNPLYDTSLNEPLSQASFLSPSLTIATSSLIEAVLYTMWAMTGRATYLLSGRVEGISQDASTDKSKLGLIQYPKYMMSILEEARLKNGRRSFSSGSSTSYGTEDIWSNGINTLNQLDELLNQSLKICSCELYIYSYVNSTILKNKKIESSMLDEISDTRDLAKVSKIAENFIRESRNTEILRLFPV